MLKKVISGVLVLLLIISMGIGTAFGQTRAADLPEKFQRGMSQKDLFDELVELYTNFRATLVYRVDGKGTFFLTETSEHHSMELKSAFVQMVQKPDGDGTTYTVTLFRANGTALTNTLTFTDGTDETGATQSFTILAGAILLETEALQTVVSGTTATTGEFIISTEWLGYANE